MSTDNIKWLSMLGLRVVGTEHVQSPGVYDRGDGDEVTVIYSVDINQEVFGPMARLVKIVSMLNESKNPAVEQQFHNLVTMLELTKESK